MSLILDALRKSEAQRRRGELPALSLELPPAPTRTSPARAWWIALPTGAVLAAIAIGWIGPEAEAPTLEHATVEAEQPRISPDVLPAEVVAAPDAKGDGAAGREPRPANPSPAAPSPPSEAPQRPAREIPVTTIATDAPILALSDLNPAERRALPPLKLSMHLWNEDPRRRFVILDGHRLGEGDRAGDAVVERIDPAGVILAADGRRIRLPLP